MVIVKKVTKDSEGQDRTGVYISKNGTPLFPGTNIVPESLRETFDKDEHFQLLVKNGLFVVEPATHKATPITITNQPDIDAVPEVAAMGDGEAIKALKGVENVLVLEAVASKDKRMNVREAAKVIISEMKEDDKKNAEKA